MSNPLGDLVNVTMGGIPGMIESGLGLLGGGGNGGSAGAVDSTSDSTADATSWSNTWGSREVASEMTQKIAETTHQAAHAARDRRATVIKEVSQSEHEALSTRVLTNYNHMHALTIQYYQVLQIYRVETRLAKVERLVYVPFKLLDFHNEAVVERYTPLFAGDSWLKAAANAMRRPDLVEMRPNIELRPPPKPDGSPVTTGRVNGDRLAPTGEDGTMERGQAAGGRTSLTVAATSAQARAAALRAALANRAQGGWNVAQLTRAANILEQPVTRAGSRSAFLPADALLTSASLDTAGDGTISIVLKSGEVLTSLVSPVSLAELDAIRLDTRSDGADRSATLHLTLEQGGVQMPLSLRGIAIAGGGGGQDLLTMRRRETAASKPQKLSTLFDAKRLAYTQRVIRSLGTHAITSLLSPYYMTAREDRHGVAGSPNTRRVPLIQLIDPKPVGFIGNYIAFRFSSAEALETYEEWAESLKGRDIDLQAPPTRQDLVPMPTGGVFAEAVLGRSNAAEKLDLTRFWNWQDSPIPIQPSDISALNAGSRATPEDTTPVGFAQPLINITQPQAMPDPSGTAAVLAAVQNGNTFRDMSGLAATIQASTAALTATQHGASTAGQQSSANLSTYIQSEVEKMRIAAQLLSNLASTAASAFTGVPTKGGTISSGGGSISNVGAATNYYDKAAGKSAPTGGGSPSSGGAAPLFSPYTGGGGDDASNSNGSAPGGGGALPPEHPLQAATWGAYGKPQADAVEGLVQASYTPTGAGPSAQAPSGQATAPALDAGPFAPFVPARLDLRIGDVLRALNTYPADSWARQIAAFAHHELSNNNLLGIFSSASVTEAKARTPTSGHAMIDAGMANLGNAFTVTTIGGPGAYAGITIVDENLVTGGTTPGDGRRRLAQVLTHELTHFRNRDFFNELNVSTVADNPSLYVDEAKANGHTSPKPPKTTPQVASHTMGETICQHVAWRVDQDLLNRSVGTAVPANPSKKKLFRYVLAVDNAGMLYWDDNGYLADLASVGLYNRQIAEWLLKIGGEKALFHDDPTKNAAVRQFFKDVYADASPDFATPAVQPDGGV